MIHWILNLKMTSPLIVFESMKEQYLKVLKYLSPQEISYIHKTSLLFIGISFIFREYRRVSHMDQYRSENKHTVPSRQTTSPARDWGRINIYIKEVARTGYEIWNFVLTLSALLDGCHSNQIIYLNLVCWRELEYLENLALSHLGFLTHRLQKTSENGNFLMSSQ